MGREEHGDRAGPQPLDELADVLARLGVEPGRRLVEEEDLRLAEQGAGERGPLAEPLGQAPGERAATVREPDDLEHLGDATLASGRRETLEPCEEGEVVLDRQSQVQPGVLRHHRDPAPDLDCMCGVEWHPGDLCSARRRREKRREHPHRGCLPGAVRAEEAEHLPPVDVECQAVDSDEVAEALRQLTHPHGGRRSW